MSDFKLDKYRLEQFRALEREARDPLAAALVHEIVTELEARLQKADHPDAAPRGTKT